MAACAARGTGGFPAAGRHKAQGEKKESNMPGLYFEDFAVGREFRHPLTRTVTEMDNTLFSL